MNFGTNLLHADDGIESLCDVSPAIHLSTTFDYTEDNEPREAVYSRESNPTVARCEAVLAKIMGAPSVTYTSGLSAGYALLVHLCPRKLYLAKPSDGGYHGSIAVAKLFQRHSGMALHYLDELEERDSLETGDIVWLESPLNPTGVVCDIAKYATKAAHKGAITVVDATFAPPPLQDPFKQGADWVLHSATKYLGGHSDLLAGVVASNNVQAIAELRLDRTALGTIPSGQTAWLLLRSLRTFEIRVARQAATAAFLVGKLSTLAPNHGLFKVAHSSLQTEAFVATQMPGGHSPTFAIYFHTKEQASAFPRQLKLFHHATSLGGVESLVEWRILSDAFCDPRLVRISIGIEDQEDLWQDLQQGIRQVNM